MGTTPDAPTRTARRTDPPWVRFGLTGLALLAMTVLVVIPVISVFYEALAEGVGTYWNNLTGDAALGAADADGRPAGGGVQHRVRHRGGVGDHAVQVPRPHAARHDDRRALLRLAG